MKRLTPLVLVLSLLAGPAHAAGMGLRWGSCEGASNRNFACDQSSGSEVLVISFSPPPGLAHLTGAAVYGHIEAANASVPPWWSLLGSGACRRGSLASSFDLSDLTDCEDTWLGQGMGGVVLDAYPGGEGLKFLVAVAVPNADGNGISTTSGRTYGVAKLIINHQRSTGPGSCAGCLTPVCITLDKMRLGQPNVGGLKEIEITQGLSGIGGAGNVVTWQGGTPQCGAGAAKPSSWGDLKKKYK